jgi:peptidyl-prolyl cis-trans isomerase B (cyclophilin B)
MVSRFASPRVEEAHMQENTDPGHGGVRRSLTRVAAVLAASSVGIAVGIASGIATPATAASAAAATAGGDVTRGPCQYTRTPDEPAARPMPLPPDPRRTPDRGHVDVVLVTSQGLLPLRLDRAQAPCTVQSFVHLVRHRFYDRTSCHRLTAYPTLSVLQCGDPSGTGEGGPGYRYRDELPTGLPPAPTDPTGERRVYARGVLAMANAGPDTNGSQFFMVYANSALRPNYTIFGTVGRIGLHTLDRIAAGGVVPTPENPAPVDGPPATRADIIVACVWR